MEVILLEDVENLGKIGDLLQVKPGYARNFLVPKRKVIPASKLSKKQRLHMLQILNTRRQKQQEAALLLKAQLEQVKLQFVRKFGGEGEQRKMFGSVTAQDVVTALADQSLQIERHDIHLSQTIKTAGEHSVEIRLSVGIKALLTLQVVAED